MKMKNEGIYLKGCLALFLTLVLWGWAAPKLISSPTDIGLVAGVLVVLIVPIFDYWIIRSIYKTIKNKNENEKQT
jgi:hypothetical protein